MHQITILGGGFAGVRTALDLDKQHLPDTIVTLISNRAHFEYHAALYRVVAGRSPLEVCIPLMEIFDETHVNVVIDSVNKVDLHKKVVSGASGDTYSFDTLVLALGSETAYFNIPGLNQYAFGFKSIEEAVRLKLHLHAVIAQHGRVSEAKHTPMHIEIIGAGASGVELAGELAVSLPLLAQEHHFNKAQIKLDLIEAAPRVMPLMAEEVSAKILTRLESLGVRVLTGRQVVKEDVSALYLKDQKIPSKTVVWTAGIKAHGLLPSIEGLPLDARGRVVVNPHMQLEGYPHVYALGDIAVTKYGGMVRTALDHAMVAAYNIGHLAQKKTLVDYLPILPIYGIPIGPGWAAVIDGHRQYYGSLGWAKRRHLDWLFLRSILPRQRALLAWQSGKRLSDSCTICAPLEAKTAPYN